MNQAGTITTMSPAVVAICAAALCVLLAADAAAQWYSYRREPPGQPQEINPIVSRVGLDQRLDTQLPLDVVVIDEQGSSRQLAEYFGEKPVILNFVYYRCPMLCTQVLNGLLKMSNAMKLKVGDDYEIVSISIYPRETPVMARKKKDRYVAQYRRGDATAGWHFLTADEATIEKLTTATGFRYEYDPKSDQYAHASGIMVLTPGGRLSRYYYGIDYNPRDVRLGLVESGNHRIGSPVDQILLLCYHYDPATGKYGFIISGFIRTFGTLFLICLGGFLWSMYRLEKRRSAAVAAQERAKSEAAATAAEVEVTP
jgi:protein SCO1